MIGVRNGEGQLVRAPYIAVAEWQQRGAVHLHVILRVPRYRVAALGAERDDARGTVRLRALEREVRAVSATARGQQVRWGSQAVAEVVSSERQRHRVAGYLAKLVQYSVKDLTMTSSTPAGAAMRAHHQRLSAAARAMRCGGDDVAAGLCAHRAREEDAPWARRCRSLAHRSWGFRGHVVRKSRSWSALTMTECRARRYRRARADAISGDVTSGDVTSDQGEAPVLWERPRDGLPMQIERFETDILRERVDAARAGAVRARAMAAEP